MKNLYPLSFALLFCLAMAITGCERTQRAFPATTPSPVATPSVACTNPPTGTTPSTYTVQMAYPIPQSSGVLAEPSAQPNGIMLSVAPTPLPTGWYVYVNSNFGLAAQGGPAAMPSPLPTPIATPFPQSTYQFFDFGFWAYDTTFSVFIANPSCYPGISVGGGSFTTGSM